MSARTLPARAAVAIAAAALAVLACGGGDEPAGPRPCFLDEANFRDLAVSPGPEPVFTWCGAPSRSLVVRSLASQREVWRVECAGPIPLCIDPGVRYGQPPPATSVAVAPLPLQPGASYEFCLTLGRTGDAPACLSFSP